MYYEVKLRGTSNEGKPIEFNYLVEGISFGDVENCAIEDAIPFCEETPVAKAIKQSNVAEVFEDPNKDKFYKCKVVMSVLDGERESRTTVVYLVSGDSAEDANKFVKERLGNEFCYEVSDISKTKICSVLAAMSAKSE